MRTCGTALQKRLLQDLHPPDALIERARMQEVEQAI
jgi:hypothetical protein